ncbi:unnamed protein product [Trichobilharzia szidati]|nr:unnamed protein product [Trichobilharzia szidati]
MDVKNPNERPHVSSQTSSAQSKVNDKTASHKLPESSESKKKLSSLTSKDEPTKSDSNAKPSSTDHVKVSDTSGVAGSTLASAQKSDEKVTDTSKTRNLDKSSHNPPKSNKENTVEKPVPNSDAPTEGQFTRILVEKLTKNITRAHIQEIFSVWGEIHSVDLPPDRIHPEFNRGYGYVEYVDAKSANDAVNFMNGGQIDGQEVRVSEVYSRPSHTSDRGGRSDDRTSYHKSRHDSSRHGRERSRNRDEHSSKGLNDSIEHNRIKEDSTKKHSSSNHSRTHDRQDRSRIHERMEDRERIKERERERPRGGRSDGMDKAKTTRRGSSGSPFANRSTDRPRSPPASSRYRRPSPPGARTSAKRPRSQSPKQKSQLGSSRDVKTSNTSHHDRKASSRSSSSSSSNSGSSSSSSSSGSGSSSSSSSSSSRS